MNKRKLVHYLAFLGAIGMLGCANTQPETGRRVGEEYLINGTSYASADVNEESVFGVESSGLKDNPKTQPNDKMLGVPGQYVKLESIKIVPEEETAYINEIVEYTINISGKIKPSTKPQFVVVLEKTGSSNGSLVIDKYKENDGEKDSYIDYAFSRTQFPPSQTVAVLTPDPLGRIRFKVHTGSSYNNKNVPMYYINVWHVDYEEDKTPVSSLLYVKRPAQIGVDDLVEGTKDVDNDLTMEGTFTSVSNLASAEIINLDPLEQQLYANASKKLHIKIEGTCQEEGSTAETTQPKPCDVGKQPVCWTFVETTEKNRGSVSEDSTGELENQYGKGKSTGKAYHCADTGEDGTFWVQVDTGNSYNSRYYLNFFHPKASPLTYQIDTFALPSDLGDMGNSATLEEDGLKFDSSSSKPNSETGEIEIVGCDAAKIIDKYIKDESVRDEIEEQCGKSSIPCTGEGTCSEDKFQCKLVQNTSGGWTLRNCSNGEVLADVDGNGTKDPVSLVIVTDENGDSYFNGLDTDGDGIVDVAPDVCIYTKCDSNYQNSFLCSDSEKGPFKPCVKQTFKMNTQNIFYVKLDGAGSDQSIAASIIRGSLPSNNAMFDSSTGSDNKTLTTDGDGIAKINFWSGTAYDAFYYIKVENEDAKTVLIPVLVSGSVSMPTAEGDKPDPSVTEPGGSATVPPPEMDSYDINMDDVVISLPADMSKEITVPVIKTLNLKVLVRKQNESKTLVSNTKTWWKVTRGDSPSNNGTLISNTATTDDLGVATNQFYTGTGYNSLYYVSVFHSNYVDEKNNPKPFIFTITTVNETGSVPGPDPTADPTLPSGTTTIEGCEGSNCECEGSKCNGEDLATVNGQETNPKLPQTSCGDVNTCKTEAEKASCSKDTGIADCCGGNAKSKSDKVGCLELILPEDSHPSAVTGSLYKAQVRLVWRNGSEITPVRDNVIWTLDKGSEADGALMSEKTMTDKNGYATVLFKTGSKETLYHINAMYPNIHKDGNMVPQTIFLNVKSVISTAAEKTETNNNITLTSNTSNIKDDINNVYYYVMSSYNYSCDDNGFLFAKQDDANTECGKRKTNLDNPVLCGLGADEPISKTFKKEIKGEIKNANDRFVVYATAYNGDRMVGYGCSDMNLFGGSYTPATCAKKGEDGKCPPERSMAVNVRLDEVPLLIKDKYHTKTVVNLGPLLDSQKDTSLYKSLDDIFAFIQKYSKIGDMIMEKLEGIVFMSENDSGENCFQAIRSVNSDSCNGTYKNLKDCCEHHSATDQCTKSEYTSCGCICGDFYYYTNTKLGKLIVPALKSGLKSLLNKYLSPEALQNTVCDAIDGLQFITLEGDLKLTKQDKVYTGLSDYSILRIPYLDEKIDLQGGLVVGKWKEAKLSNGVDQMSFQDYTLKLTYGEYIYKILGKMVGLLNTETGEINFDINCEKIFANGILGIGSKGLIGLCKIATARVNTEAMKFAVSKYVDLNLTLQGSAEFVRGESCVSDSGTPGCVAQLIQKGTWSGSGSLGEDRVDGKTKDTTINGVWVGRVDEKGDTWPEMTFGGQSLDEFIASNSICRKKMKEDFSKGKTLDTNKACLLGSFDNAGRRSTMNACDQNGCKDGGAIVVCEGGKFVEKYNNSTAADIIRAANKVCASNSGANGCKSSEIVNGGKGINNTECLEDCSKEACTNNTSIFVCDGNGTAYTQEQLDTICSDVGISSYGTECIQKTVKSLCEGKTDDPGCIMNSDNTLVYNTESGASKPDDPVATEEEIAHITFESIEKPQDDGPVGDNKGFSVTYKCVKAKEDSQLKAKSVAGPDGTLNAVGSRAIYGPPADNSYSEDQCYFMISSPATLDKKITKVVFKINPADRNIKYDYKKSASDTFSGGTPIYGNDWNTVKIDLASGVKSNFVQIRIWPNEDKSADYNKYKMYRLADIQVYGY